MSQSFDVCVRGGGVVGQSLALLLARERLRVALVRHPVAHDAPADIRAYALNAAARALLLSLRVWPDDAHATPVRRMEVREHGMADALRFDMPTADSDPLAWIVDVPALERRLHDAVGFQSAITPVAEPVPAELTVICEGKRSGSRESLGFDHQQHPYAHTALAARLQCEQPHEGVARQWFHQGEIMAWLPLDGAQGQRVALVWSVAHERARALQALAPEALAAKVRAAGASALGEMRLDGPPATWPLTLARASRWLQRHDGQAVALAGDAAHAMHPLAGQGLNVGLGDVAELARVLASREPWRAVGDWRLLRRYERARQADVAQMQWLTDGLYGLFSHSDPRVQSLRQWGLRRFDGLAPLKRWAMQRAAGRVVA